MIKYSSKLKRLILCTSGLLALSACSSIDTTKLASKTVSYHPKYQHNSSLDTFFSQNEYDTEKITGFYPLERGHDALLARLALIENAESHLDLQYYIYRDDETSKLLTWRLYEAAKRGVKVRLLLDDMQRRSDKDLASLNAHPNIDVRLFNPHEYRDARNLSFVSDFERMNRRMHNKSLTADSVASIVGGRNIGNEYFSFESQVEFGDFDLLIYGNTVEQTADQFDLYWNSDYAIPMKLVYPKAQLYTDEEIDQLVKASAIEEKFTSGIYDFTQLSFYKDLQAKQLELYWGKGNLWYDTPDKISGSNRSLVDNLVEMLHTVDHSMVLISPYFVPTKEGTQQLVSAVKNGKEITVITNSLASNDVFAVHGWYAKYRKELVAGGVQLWEVKANAELDSQWSFTGSSRSSLHAKAILFDEQRLFVGSMNWDPRSVYLNTEMAVVIEHPEYVQQSLLTMMERLQVSAYEIVIDDGNVAWLDHQTGNILTKEPQVSVWRRFGSWLSGMLPIEDQLKRLNTLSI